MAGERKDEEEEDDDALSHSSLSYYLLINASKLSFAIIFRLLSSIGRAFPS